MKTFDCFKVFLLGYIFMLASSNVFAMPLTNQTLSGALSSSYNWGYFSPSTSAVVGAGVEFNILNDDPAGYIANPYFSIDFDESGLVTVSSLKASLTMGGPLLLTFTDIDSQIDDIIGFDLISKTAGLNGIYQSDLSFAENSVSMQLGNGVNWFNTVANPDVYASFTAQISFGDDGSGDNGGTIPEPATIALMGLGLAGIGYRRKVK